MCFRDTVLVSLLVLLPAVFGGSTGRAAEHRIVVVYPRAGQTIGAVDSTFILGHVPARIGDYSYVLRINDQQVEVHPDGGFLAYLPISPGPFTFHLTAILSDKDMQPYQARIKRGALEEPSPYPEVLTDSLAVLVPEPWPQPGFDSLVILRAGQLPAQDMVISEGDRLVVSFRGTPGCRAWFSLDSLIDSIPMVETEPAVQPYWGEAVFGSGVVPDSLLVRGIYTGYVEIDRTMRIDTARICYHLAPPAALDVVARLFGSTCLSSQIELPDYMKLLRLTDAVEVEGASRITLNSPEYPFTVEFVDSVQIVRHGPRRGYLSVFQPAGVRALATAAAGEWYRLALSPSVDGWVHRQSVRALPKGILPPHSYVRAVRTYSSDSDVRLEFGLAGRHPFRISTPDSRTIVVDLFGVTADTDWIRFDYTDTMIESAQWSQPEEQRYRFAVRLNHDLWGYDTYYSGAKLCLQLLRPPDDLYTLRGKRIVIDPGHSLDPGAIGPTGLTEAEANLMISRELARCLENRGADVIMTRSDDSDLPLYDRPAIAKSANADLFVSVHNNALPDGVNPFVNHGTSSYYYHLHSAGLARAIHRRMVDKLDLPDHGLYHGNLAVLRPTQYPAVLVECTMIIRPDQEARIRDEGFRGDISSAIADGIEDFLRESNDGR